MSETPEKKSQVADIDRSLYDFRYEESDEDFYKIRAGLDESIVQKISEEKGDPEWMKEWRLKSLRLYNEIREPDWGPDIRDLDIQKIVTYVKPKTDMAAKWQDVPDDIKNTFEKLGIPEAERMSLAGVGAQYDSELVYHNVKDEVLKQGVIYTDFESALKSEEWGPMVKEYFMHLVPPSDHKFAALHGALWSGGSFVYVPKGVKVDIPLQSYFRLNAAGAGQFEHTLIIVDEGADLHFIEGCSAPKYNVANLHAGCVELYVKKNARLRYSTIENWSKNMYNLNTKRAVVEENGRMEWVSGSFGSHISYLYPTTILKGDNASCEFTGITFAGEGQNLDTGAKMIHIGKNTRSTIVSKGISAGKSQNSYRGLVRVSEKAENARNYSQCDSLLLGSECGAHTFPYMDIHNETAIVEHEATTSKISEDQLFYCNQRGINTEDAVGLIVNGYAKEVINKLPMEFAVEAQKLLAISLEGSVG